MLLELYIGLMAINFIIWGLAFFRKNIWFWSITLVLSGLLIFSSFNIVQNTAVMASQYVNGSSINYTYEIMTSTTSDWSLFGLNLGVFLLALVFFLNDLFISFKEGKLGGREY
jgi:hypothetical protein